MEEVNDVWAGARKWQRIRNALLLFNIGCIILMYFLAKNGHFKSEPPPPKSQVQSHVDTPLYTNFATPIETFGKIIAKGGARMREKPISSSKLLTKIEFYESVKILDKGGPEDFIAGQSGTWYKVEYNSYEGWVWGPFVKEDN
jgi:hypothetical protein